MSLPSSSDNQEKPVSGNVQNISGKNVVGTINAEGSAQVNINQINYNQLSEVEEERERQKAELDVLQSAIKQKYTDLNRLAGAAMPSIGNPYLFLQPFGVVDHARFFGRENEVAELFERVIHNAITFLNGNTGSGKTSLLKAGLTPALLEQQHLPLMVSVKSESLEASIKKEFLPNIDGMPFLKTIALTEFIRIVTSALPDGKMLFILVDDFDEFFNDKEHTELERNAFYNEWQRCFNGAALNAHWLFCIPLNLQHLLNFFKREVQPNPNTISVSPFDRASAQTVIFKPAEARGIQVEEGVVPSILDILGPNNIDPADLQIVCYILAGGNGTLSREWTMDYYAAQGRADGILRDYLDRTIEGLQIPEREPAWQVLAVLTDPAMQTSTEEQIVEKMKLYNVEEHLTHRVLVNLESSNLIEHGAAYKLGSDSLRPRIEKWKETRSARERAREEAIQQLQAIRNSALRGLLAGAVGFFVFDQILYKLSFPGFSYYLFKFLFDTAIGALPGLILVFFVDISLASYNRQKRWLAYLAGALSGALAFTWMLVPYSLLIHSGDTFRAIAAIPEGVVWGAVTGIAMIWTLTSRRSYWITISTSLLLCGLTLMAANSIFGVLTNPRIIRESMLWIGLAGAILPGFILAAAVIGRRKFHS
jgi:hypothetical protein